MFFTKTRKYNSSIPKADLIDRMTGSHVTIHDLDFEITEKDGQLRIIPHAEQVNAIKTLPITHVDVKNAGNTTDVVVTSKMRKLDAAGPQLIVIFCSFLLCASLILLYVGGEPMTTYALLSISSVIFVVFYVRMQMGYFDYVRKIHHYIKQKTEFA